MDMPLGDMACLILKRFPYYTLIYVVVCIFMFFRDDTATQGNLAYVHDRATGTSSEWYTPMSATFLHVNGAHLWLNMCMLGMGGGLLEFTEGHYFMLTLHLGAGPLAFGFHGFGSRMRVRGASGVIYAIIFSQVALLKLNWRELRCERWVRLLMLSALIAMEVSLYITSPAHSTSYLSHLFGALIGICISLVCAKNVKVTWWEPIVIALAFGAYVSFCIFIFITGQFACAIWGLGVTPKLLLNTYMYWRKARLVRQGARAPLA